VETHGGSRESPSDIHGFQAGVESLLSPSAPATTDRGACHPPLRWVGAALPRPTYLNQRFSFFLWNAYMAVFAKCSPVGLAPHSSISACGLHRIAAGF